jgi:archaellum component FlaC
MAKIIVMEDDEFTRLIRDELKRYTDDTLKREVKTVIKDELKQMLDNYFKGEFGRMTSSVGGVNENVSKLTASVNRLKDKIS